MFWVINIELIGFLGPFLRRLSIPFTLINDDIDLVAYLDLSVEGTNVDYLVEHNVVFVFVSIIVRLLGRIFARQRSVSLL